MLDERRVQTSVLYPALHELSAYRDRAADLPRSELIGRAELTLPLFPTLSEDDQDRVVSALADGVAQPRPGGRRNRRIAHGVRGRPYLRPSERPQIAGNRKESAGVIREAGIRLGRFWTSFGNDCSLV